MKSPPRVFAAKHRFRVIQQHCLLERAHPLTVATFCHFLCRHVVSRDTMRMRMSNETEAEEMDAAVAQAATNGTGPPSPNRLIKTSSWTRIPVECGARICATDYVLSHLQILLCSSPPPGTRILHSFFWGGWEESMVPNYITPLGRSSSYQLLRSSSVRPATLQEHVKPL